MYPGVLWLWMHSQLRFILNLGIFSCPPNKLTHNKVRTSFPIMWLGSSLFYVLNLTFTVTFSFIDLGKSMYCSWNISSLTLPAVGKYEHIFIIKISVSSGKISNKEIIIIFFSLGECRRDNLLLFSWRFYTSAGRSCECRFSSLCDQKS